MDKIEAGRTLLSQGVPSEGTSVGGTFILHKEEIVSFSSIGSANLGTTKNSADYYISFLQPDVNVQVANANLAGTGVKSASLATHFFS